jgi:hypothetical protein
LQSNDSGHYSTVLCAIFSHVPDGTFSASFLPGRNGDRRDAFYFFEASVETKFWSKAPVVIPVDLPGGPPLPLKDEAGGP